MAVVVVPDLGHGLLVQQVQLRQAAHRGLLAQHLQVKIIKFQYGRFKTNKKSVE